MFRSLFFRKKYQYEDTRQYPRLPAAWPIKCEPLTPEDKLHLAQTKDVSAGGVAMVVREMIPVGSWVRLEVYVPTLGRAIASEGQVVRCLPLKKGGFDLGIRFRRIEPMDQQALREEIGKLGGSRLLSQPKRTWWRTVR